MQLKPSRVFLAGFMGAGKTVVGPLVARILNWEFEDLDQTIESIEKKEISEIFQIQGESYFRDLESEVLKNAVRQPLKVISLGGGTVLRKENLQVVHSSGLMIYLRTKASTLAQRLGLDAQNRPLLKLGRNEDLEEFISQILNQRIHLYESGIAIDTDSLSVLDVAEKIAEIVKVSHEANHIKVL